MGENVLTAQCACGATIRYQPKHVGRTVKCSGCGNGVLLEGPDDPVDWNLAAPDDSREERAVDSGAYGLEAPEVKLPGHSPVASQMDAAARDPRAPSRMLGREKQLEIRRERGFWRDAALCFTFWTKPESAITLIVVTALLLVRIPMVYVPFLGLIVWLGITGMVWGFYLEVIRYSAGGDDDLPDPSDWDNFWDSAVLPIVRLVAVTGACALPAIGARAAGFGAVSIFIAAVTGVFLWPVAMLAASIGGAGAALRLDLLVRTIISAPIAYAFVWIMLLVAGLATSLSLLEGMGVLPAGLERSMAHGVGAVIISTFMGVYTTIITMKLIGLYYRHYSDRFPWDAG